ncbi:MAG TPA: efflux RND transporter periplasmic adaptor subunit [Ignavibacteria bacterium]
MKKVIIIGLLSLILIIIIYRAYQNYKIKQEVMNQPVPEKIIPVKTAIPVKIDVVSKIIASGNLYAESEVTIYSKVSGKIQKNLVQMNSKVKNGDILSIVDRDEIGYEYKPYEVKSNINGVVSKVLQNPGAIITPNTPLMNIVEIDKIKAIAAVDELKIRFIKIGQEAIVTLQAYPDESFKAKVSNISPICNPQNRTIDVEVLIKNENYKLKPGMYANIEFKEGYKKSLFVPISAVIEKLEKKYVFINSNGKAKALQVNTGSIMGDKIEILEGLTGNEEVIIVGADKVNDNDKINIIK